MVRPAAKPKDEIVGTIARVFRRYGYEGATMSILSRDTGLGRSSLYHHFAEGKEDMASQALAMVEDHFENEVFPLLEASSPPIVKLARFTKRLNDYYEGGRLGCLLAAFSLQGSPSAVAGRVSALFERWIGALARVYGEGGLPRSDAMRRARRVVAGLQGALVLTTATRDASHLEDALTAMRTINERGES